MGCLHCCAGSHYTVLGCQFYDGQHTSKFLKQKNISKCLQSFVKNSADMLHMCMDVAEQYELGHHNHCLLIETAWKRKSLILFTFQVLYTVPHQGQDFFLATQADFRWV